MLSYKAAPEATADRPFDAFKPYTNKNGGDPYLPPVTMPNVTVSRSQNGWKNNLSQLLGSVLPCPSLSLGYSVGFSYLCTMSWLGSTSVPWCGPPYWWSAVRGSLCPSHHHKSTSPDFWLLCVSSHLFKAQVHGCLYLLLVLTFFIPQFVLLWTGCWPASGLSWMLLNALCPI